MVGCNGSANGNLLPIQAGPTSTSCPEQTAFVPFPRFFHPAACGADLHSAERGRERPVRPKSSRRRAMGTAGLPRSQRVHRHLVDVQPANRSGPSVMHVLWRRPQCAGRRRSRGQSMVRTDRFDAGSATAMGVRMGTLDVVPAHRHFAGHLFGQHLHRHPVDCRAPGLLGPVALERLPGRWPVGIAGDPARRNLEWRWVTEPPRPAPCGAGILKLQARGRHTVVWTSPPAVPTPPTRKSSPRRRGPLL